MKEHPIISEYILSEVDLPPIVRQIARSSHERMDGRGYPDGKKGDDIPLPARIVLVADAFDAMTSDRPYRKRRHAVAAIEELRAHAGRQFCPKVVARWSRSTRTSRTSSARVCCGRSKSRRKGRLTLWGDDSVFPFAHNVTVRFARVLVPLLAAIVLLVAPSSAQADIDVPAPSVSDLLRGLVAGGGGGSNDDSGPGSGHDDEGEMKRTRTTTAAAGTAAAGT